MCCVEQYNDALVLLRLGHNRAQLFAYVQRKLQLSTTRPVANYLQVPSANGPAPAAASIQHAYLASTSAAPKYPIRSAEVTLTLETRTTRATTSSWSSTSASVAPQGSVPFGPELRCNDWRWHRGCGWRERHRRAIGMAIYPAKASEAQSGSKIGGPFGARIG